MRAQDVHKGPSVDDVGVVFSLPGGTNAWSSRILKGLKYITVPEQPSLSFKQLLFRANERSDSKSAEYLAECRRISAIT